MKNNKIGIIGTGNMGTAILLGMLGADLVEKEQIWAADRNEESLKKLSESYGIEHVTTQNETIAKEVDILILAVKPNIYPAVIEKIRSFITNETLLISIAAGQSIARIEALFAKEIKLIRVMPNTPVLVQEGMSALSFNKNVTKEDGEKAGRIFASFGKCEIIPESLMETVIGISGSSPAYVFMFIEAMADAAVLGGMQRKEAYRFAAQAVLGSAKMVLETGLHPGALKDGVCSPGGTTIAAVESLEKNGFRGTVMEGVRACIEKAKEMEGGK